MYSAIHMQYCSGKDSDSTWRSNPFMLQQFCSTCSVYRLEPQHQLQEMHTKRFLNIVQNTVIIQSLLQIANVQNLNMMTTYVQFISISIFSSVVIKKRNHLRAKSIFQSPLPHGCIQYRTFPRLLRAYGQDGSLQRSMWVRSVAKRAIFQ